MMEGGKEDTSLRKKMKSTGRNWDRKKKNICDDLIKDGLKLRCKCNIKLIKGNFKSPINNFPIDEDLDKENERRKFWIKTFYDSKIINLWTSNITNRLPYICDCCREHQCNLYKKVMTVLLKVGSFAETKQIPPIEQTPLKEIQFDGNRKSQKKKTKQTRSSIKPSKRTSKLLEFYGKNVECHFCVCTILTCPVIKRNICMETIKGKAHYISSCLMEYASESINPRGRLVDRKGFLGRCDGKIEKLNYDVYKQTPEVVPCIRYPKFHANDSTPSISDDEDYYTDITELPKVERFFLIGIIKHSSPKTQLCKCFTEGTNTVQDDVLFGEDAINCEVCYKIILIGTYTFIFKRQRKKLIQNSSKLSCICRYVNSLQNIDNEENNVFLRKDSKNFKALVQQVSNVWDVAVEEMREKRAISVEPEVYNNLEEFARILHWSQDLDIWQPSPSISASTISTENDDVSITNTDLIKKVNFVANKFTKRFPPCAAFSEEYEDDIDQLMIDCEKDEQMSLLLNNLRENVLKLQAKLKEPRPRVSLDESENMKICWTHEHERLAAQLRHDAEKLANIYHREELEIAEEEEEEENLEEESEKVNVNIVEDKADESSYQEESSSQEDISFVDECMWSDVGGDAEKDESCTIDDRPSDEDLTEEYIISKDKNQLPIADSYANTSSDEENIETFQYLLDTIGNRITAEATEEQEECKCMKGQIYQQPSDIDIQKWISQNWKKGLLTERLEKEKRIPVDIKIKINCKTVEELEESSAEDKIKIEQPVITAVAKPAAPTTKVPCVPTHLSKNLKTFSTSQKKRKDKESAKKEAIHPNKLAAHSLGYDDLIKYIKDVKLNRMDDIIRLYKHPLLKLPHSSWERRDKLFDKLRKGIPTSDDGQIYGLKRFVFEPPPSTEEKTETEEQIKSQLQMSAEDTDVMYGLLKRKIIKYPTRHENWIHPFKKGPLGLKSLPYTGKYENKIAYLQKIMKMPPLKLSNWNYEELYRKNEQPCTDKVPDEKLEIVKPVCTKHQLKKRVKHIDKTESSKRQKENNKKKMMKENRELDCSNLMCKQKRNENLLQKTEYGKRYYLKKKKTKIIAAENIDIKSAESENILIKDGNQNENEKRQDKKKNRRNQSNKDASNRRESKSEKGMRLKKSSFKIDILEQVPSPPKYPRNKHFMEQYVAQFKERNKRHKITQVHPAYAVRNILLKQIKRLDMPRKKEFIKKMNRIRRAYEKLKIGYRLEAKINRRGFNYLNPKSYSLFRYNYKGINLKRVDIKDILTIAFDVLYSWYSIKSKLIKVHRFLRSARFDEIMAPLVLVKKPDSIEELINKHSEMKESEKTTLRELKKRKEELIGQLNVLIEDKLYLQKNPTIRKRWKEFENCKKEYLKRKIKKKQRKALKFYELMKSLLNCIYRLKPPTTLAIKLFIIPKLLAPSESKAAGLVRKRQMSLTKSPSQEGSTQQAEPIKTNTVKKLAKKRRNKIEQKNQEKNINR